MSISGFIQLSPCCCSVCSTFQSPCQAWGLWEARGKGCRWVCRTGKALGDAGMEVGKVRLCWGWGSRELWEDTGLGEGALLPAGSEQSRGPSSPQPAPRQGMSPWPGWGFREVQSMRGKSSFGQHFSSLRHRQPTTIRVS